MKKIFIIGVMAMLIVGVLSVSTIAATGPETGPGPAPSSGDSFSDGPEWETHPGEDNTGIGPAPGSGDGTPDGSGF